MRAPAFSPPLLADVLLHGWEDYTFPPHTAARPLAVAVLGQVRPAALALDLEDVHATLRRARSFGHSCATDAGPGRATRLGPAAVAACQRAHLDPPPAGPPVLALLALASHPAAELEMDELSEIVETLQATLGPDVEITFWHGGKAVLPPAVMQFWLMLGYS